MGDMVINIPAGGSGYCAYFQSEVPYDNLPCVAGNSCPYFHGVYGGRGISCEGTLEVKPEVGTYD